MIRRLEIEVVGPPMLVVIAALCGVPSAWVLWSLTRLDSGARLARNQ